MIDFTSALYLGIEHRWASLPAWPRLTLGRPAALGRIPGTAQVEGELARLAGGERAILATSTLHAFHDLFAAAGPEAPILLDDEVYPIARLVAGARGRSLQREWPVGPGRAPIVVADGYLPFRGSSPPLDVYGDAARGWGGLLAVDDTQAFGLGAGGRGAAPEREMERGHVLVIASMAKAFGAPVAFLAGGAGAIARIERSGFTRMHCSPPSAAAVAAAALALETNRRCGDALREKLRANVAKLRRGLGDWGLVGVSGLFPVQPVGGLDESEARDLHAFLRRAGVGALLARGSPDGPARLVFVLTARHTFREIDSALTVLRAWHARQPRGERRGIWNRRTAISEGSSGRARSRASAATRVAVAIARGE